MIYLVGAAGFVGSAFGRLFERERIEFTPISRENYTRLAGSECDILINANGSSKKYLATQDPKLDFSLNVQSVLNTLFDFKCRLYVLVSTIDVYSDVSDPQNSRETVHIQPESLSNYGFHKYLAELCVHKYAPDWLVLRLGGMVGEGLKKNSIYDLLHNSPLWVHPDSAYQYMNTDDMALTAWRLISQGRKNETFNLCGDGVITMREVQEMLHIPYADNGKRKEHYEINIDKAKRLCDIPLTSEAVRSFIAGAGDGHEGNDDK